MLPDAVFAFLARQGRILLILGLVAGILLPPLADAMRPLIAPLIACLLFLAALRVGPRQAVGALRDLGASAGLATLFQLVMPLCAAAAIHLAGWSGTPLGTFFVLMLAAAPVTGAPNLTIMTGNDPGPALRLLVVGTVLLPLTVVPVFWVTPALGEASEVFGAAGGLLLLIAAAAGLAFTLRLSVLKEATPRLVSTVDGLSALAMGIVVIGLMSAVGPALRDDPLRVLAILVLVCAVNFGIQIAATLAARAAGSRTSSAAIGVTAGNRNIALFLTVLPEDVVGPILLAIGCFQIPMYVTPAALGRFYRP